jgi:hypothetical protein
MKLNQAKLHAHFKQVTGSEPLETIAENDNKWTVLFTEKLTAYTLFIEYYNASPSIRVGFSKNLQAYYLTNT